MVVFESSPDVMRPMNLTDVDIGCVLIIAKLERAAGISIPHIRNTCYLKAGNTLIDRARTVGSRNVQYVGSIIAVIFVPVGADVLARKSDVAIKYQRRRSTIRQTSRSDLDAPSGVPRISAVESIPAGNRPQHQRATMS